MSTESITRLEEEARELVEGYFNSTPMGEMLMEAYVIKDYDELRRLIKWARDIQFDVEYRPRFEADPEDYDVII